MIKKSLFSKKCFKNNKKSFVESSRCSETKNYISYNKNLIIKLKMGQKYFLTELSVSKIVIPFFLTKYFFPIFTFSHTHL